MTFRTDAHGRYDIRSGPLAGAWAANAYRRKILIAKASGSTREEAIELVREQLDQLDRATLSDRDDEGAPSAKVYEEAFAVLLPDMPDSYLAMLRAHLDAPDRLLSATRLAEAAGYSGYEGANLHYGKLGQRVAEEIGFVPPRRADGTEIWTCALAPTPLCIPSSRRRRCSTRCRATSTRSTLSGRCDRRSCRRCERSVGSWRTRTICTGGDRSFW